MEEEEEGVIIIIIFIFIIFFFAGIEDFYYHWINGIESGIGPGGEGKSGFFSFLFWFEMGVEG